MIEADDVRIVAVDVGNTAVKLCLQLPETVACVAIPLADPNWSDSAVDWVEKHIACRDSQWRIADVQCHAADRLHEAVRRSCTNAKTVRITRHDVPMKLLVDHPDRLGIDRLLGAWAAHRRFGGPVVIVDAGSAVTIDRVDEQGQFAGGAILPGLRMQTSSLATGTDALPQIDWQSEQVLVTPATNTVDAIRLGVLSGISAAVDRLVDQYAGKNTSAGEMQLVLTGGDARTIAPWIHRRHQVIDNLVCRGLLDL